MENGINIENTIPYYPAQNDPNIQALISRLKEFNELASFSTEKLKVGNFPYNHQELIKRLLKVYRGLILIHDAGTGKTRAVLEYTEYCYTLKILKDEQGTTNDPINDHFKRCVILAGKNQQEEIRGQLVKVIAPDRYSIDSVNNAVNNASRDTVITKLLGKFYEFHTYTAFANEIIRKKQDKGYSIKNEFSDCIFWIDEGHSIIPDKVTSDTTIKLKESLQTYNIIMEVVHSPRSNTIVTTASPITDSPKELKALVNIVLPLDGVLPEDFDPNILTDKDKEILFPNYDFELMGMNYDEMGKHYRGQIPGSIDMLQITLDVLEVYLRGRISYVRSLDTGATPIMQGDKVIFTYRLPSGEYINSGLILSFDVMSDFQRIGYNKSREQKTNTLITSRLASNFVFPDGTFKSDDSQAKKKSEGITYEGEGGIVTGRVAKSLNTISMKSRQKVTISKKVSSRSDSIIEDRSSEPLTEREDRSGFNRYIAVDNQGIYHAVPSLATQLSTIDGVRKCSCKYASICNRLKNNPAKTYCYTYFVKSGAIMLGLSIRYSLGYEQYDGSIRAFTGRANERIIDLVPISRYAIISGITSNSKMKNILELYNCDENRHGQYLRVIILTEVAKEGISLDSVIDIDLIESDWIPASDYQAYSRGIRTISHNGIIDERVTMYMNQGMTFEEALENAKITVNIYRHSAISSYSRIKDNIHDLEIVTSDNSSYYVPSDDSNNHIYLRSELKDIINHRKLRMLKIISIDAQIHKNRNIRSTDIDYTVESDYLVSHYSAYKENKLPIDDSNYLIEYNRDNVEEVIIRLKDIYRTHDHLHINELSHLSGTNYYTMLVAIREMINNRERIMNRYGFYTYIRQDGNYYYLDRRYPNTINGDMSMAYYSSQLVGVTKIQLEDILYSVSSIEVIPIHDNAVAKYKGEIKKLEYIKTSLTDIYQNYNNYVEYMFNTREDIEFKLIHDVNDDIYHMYRNQIESLFNTEGIDMVNIELKTFDTATTYVADHIYQRYRDNLINLLRTMSGEHKASILEISLYNIMNGINIPNFDEDNLVIDKIVESTFRRYRFYVSRPTALLKEEMERKGLLLSNKLNKGKKKPKNKKIKILYTDREISMQYVQENTNDPMIYLHNIYTQLSNFTRHGLSARYNKSQGNIRILQFGDQWRELTAIEKTVYSAFIKDAVGRETISQIPYHGYIDLEGFFVLKILKDKIREENIGMRIGSYTPEVLQGVLYDLYNMITFEEPESISIMMPLLDSRGVDYTGWSEKKMYMWYLWLCDFNVLMTNTSNIDDNKAFNKLMSIAMPGGIILGEKIKDKLRYLSLFTE